MRRSSVSLPSNITEGSGRSSDNEFKRFLEIAYGSLYELQTQLIISKKLSFISDPLATELDEEIIEIQKMIYTYTQRFN